MGVEARLARPPARSLAWSAVALLGIALCTRDAWASDRVPVVIRVLGPKAVGVRVSEGTTAPCDSGDNRPLVRGKFEPGTVIQASTTAGCVCAQHTLAPFVDSDWTESTIYCLHMICRGRSCAVTRPPTIRIDVRSDS